MILPNFIDADKSPGCRLGRRYPRPALGVYFTSRPGLTEHGGLRTMEKEKPTSAEIAEENRNLRRLRFMVDFTLSLIYQSDMSREEALQHINRVKGYALRLFPGKELAFELLYAPRFKRAIREIYGFH